MGARHTLRAKLEMEADAAASIGSMASWWWCVSSEPAMLDVRESAGMPARCSTPTMATIMTHTLAMPQSEAQKVSRPMKR